MRSWKFPKSIGNYTLKGRSRAADATAFSIAELDWMLDCGAIVDTTRPTHVFVTHTHSDHANRVTHVVSRARPPQIYVPGTASDLMEGYINAHQAMTDNRPVEELLQAMAAGAPEWKVNRVIAGVHAGDEIVIERKGKTFVVEVLACDHSVDCVGYGVSERKKSLKKEYQGLPGKEIGALRKAGTEVTEDRLVPLFAFMGDTTTKAFEEVRDDVGNVTAAKPLKYPVIITECTFIEEAERKNAERTRHTHWADLEPVMLANSNTTFILIHFSLRYKAKDVVNMIASRTQKLREDGNADALANVVPWISLPEEIATSERLTG